MQSIVKIKILLYVLYYVFSFFSKSTWFYYFNCWVQKAYFWQNWWCGLIQKFIWILGVFGQIRILLFKIISHACKLPQNTCLVRIRFSGLEMATDIPTFSKHDFFGFTGYFQQELKINFLSKPYNFSIL